MVDDDVQAMFRVLCDHQRAKGPGADMSLAELQLALGITEAHVLVAVKVLRLWGDLFIAYTTPAWDRVTPGPAWLSRCKYEGQAEE